MATSEKLVVRRQGSVERLLGEVKDEYNKAMKAAIIDYRRKDPVEEAKMTALRLPPQLTPPPPPYLAVVDTGVHLQPFSALCAAVSGSHYTRHPEATQVVLALFPRLGGVVWQRVLRFAVRGTGVAAPQRPRVPHDSQRLPHLPAAGVFDAA